VSCAGDPAASFVGIEGLADWIEDRALGGALRSAYDDDMAGIEHAS
jgi:hypothetical protein